MPSACVSILRSVAQAHWAVSYGNVMAVILRKRFIVLAVTGTVPVVRVIDANAGQSNSNTS